MWVWTHPQFTIYIRPWVGTRVYTGLGRMSLVQSWRFCATQSLLLGVTNGRERATKSVFCWRTVVFSELIQEGSQGLPFIAQPRSLGVHAEGGRKTEEKKKKENRDTREKGFYVMSLPICSRGPSDQSTRMGIPPPCNHVTVVATTMACCPLVYGAPRCYVALRGAACDSTYDSSDWHRTRPQ